MKIYTRLEHRWNGSSYELVRANWFYYVGPIARCDGGDGGGYSGDKGGVPSDSGGEFPNGDMPSGDVPGGDVPGGDAPSSPSPSGSAPSAGGSESVLKGVGEAAAKTAAQTGVMMGLNAVNNRGASSQSDAFNKQLQGLVSSANNQSYDAAQAVPLSPVTPGLSGSSGKPGNPAATVANMNLPAPVSSSTSSTAAGTQLAPSSPAASGQTGAIKLGVRPQSYA